MTEYFLAPTAEFRFKCRPRDQWIGWKRELQFTRMHLIANNTRFLILGAPGCFPNLASFALAAMVQRLSADWSAAYGHSLLLAETFVDPSKFCGHMYKEAGWTRLGQTKGYARANGRYTDPHGVPKDLHVFPLHRDTRSRMCAPDPLPDPLLPNPMGDASEQPLHGLSSVYEEFLRVPDFRRAQGRKHTIASVLTIDTVASLSGFESGIGAAQFARALNQTELKMLGAWFNPKTKKYEPCQSAFNGDPLSASEYDPPPGGWDRWGGVRDPLLLSEVETKAQPDLFYADHPRLPFHRCTTKRSFCNQTTWVKLDADFPPSGSSLQAFPQIAP